MHALYVGQDSSNEVFVVADDTDIYLSMINVAYRVKSCLYFSTRKNQRQRGSNLS